MLRLKSFPDYIFHVVSIGLYYIFTQFFKLNIKSKAKWASPQYNESHPTPLFFSKGQGLEIGNQDGMQPLHKIYGLITYLICTVYSYNKI